MKILSTEIWPSVFFLEWTNKTVPWLGEKGSCSSWSSRTPSHSWVDQPKSWYIYHFGVSLRSRMTYITSMFLAGHNTATYMTSVQIKTIEKLGSQEAATSKVLVSAVTDYKALIQLATLFFSINKSEDRLRFHLIFQLNHQVQQIELQWRRLACKSLAISKLRTVMLGWVFKLLLPWNSCFLFKNSRKIRFGLLQYRNTKWVPLI